MTDALETPFGTLDISALDADALRTDLGPNCGDTGRHLTINGVNYWFSSFWDLRDGVWVPKYPNGRRAVRPYRAVRPLNRAPDLEMTPAAEQKLMAALPPLVAEWAEAHPAELGEARAERREREREVLERYVGDLRGKLRHAEEQLELLRQGRPYEHGGERRS